MRRCSYCYKTGHNRRTCPSLKQYIAENPDSYAARSAARAKAEKKPSNRRCSFCHERGHTKRTCEVRRSATAVVTTKNRQFRRKLRRALARQGWLPGALVRYVPKTTENGLSDQQVADARVYFDQVIQGQDNLHVAMIVGYDTSAMNFDYFRGSSRAPAIWVMTPTGKRSRLPLPDSVGDVVEGSSVAVEVGPFSYHHYARPWTFMSIEVAGRSTVKTPQRFLTKHLGEMFFSGEANSQEMVDQNPGKYSDL